MASSYPSGLDSFSTSHTDNTGEVIHAATVNDLADAINKIEAELGTLPKGAAASVAAKLNALYYGIVTTAQRNALSSPANGLLVYNSDVSKYEVNTGSSGSPVWKVVGPTFVSGLISAQPVAGNSNKYSWYFATDQQGGTLYFSNGSAWTQVAAGITAPPQNNSITDAMIQSAVITGDKLVNGTITGTQITSSVALAGNPTTTTQAAGDNSTKIATTAFVTNSFPGYGTSFPTSSLITGQTFTLFVNTVTAWQFIYRPDVDATYSWIFIGGAPVGFYNLTSLASQGSWVATSTPSTFTLPRAGTYRVSLTAQTTGGEGGVAGNQAFSQTWGISVNGASPTLSRAAGGVNQTGGFEQANAFIVDITSNLYSANDTVQPKFLSNSGGFSTTAGACDFEVLPIHLI
jgi:hypothetical protein